MNKALLTGVLICSITLSGSLAVSGQSVTWKYSEENREKTYVGKWVTGSTGFQFFLPTDGWESVSPEPGLTEETEAETDSAAPGAETEAGTKAEAAAETETEAAAGTETAVETETETEAAISEIEAFQEAGTDEYALMQPDEGIKLRLYHFETDDQAYPSIDDLSEMVSEGSNIYTVECNGIRAVHFDFGDTENLAFPEVMGDEEEGFAGSVAVLSAESKDREKRELFADELFCSVKLGADDPELYLVDGLIWSDRYTLSQIQDASDKYVRMLAHKKFFSNENEDESNPATGFALMDLNEDGIMEILIQYDGSDPSSSDEEVTDYALYTCSGGEEKLLLTMEGRGDEDVLYYYPQKKMLDYDTYDDAGDGHFDCYTYDGSDITHFQYYEIEWSEGDDEGNYLTSEDFIFDNTEEERELIKDKMLETMTEHMGEIRS